MKGLYLDTSCLLKLFFPESESLRVAAIIGDEGRVVVSLLAKLETLIQIEGRLEGGLLSRRTAMSLWQKVEKVLATAPHEVVSTPLDWAEVALRQVLPLGASRHCRTADRLHLAIMQSLEIRRILTNDDVQAAAARQMGFEAIVPRP